MSTVVLANKGSIKNFSIFKLKIVNRYDLIMKMETLTRDTQFLKVRKYS